MEARLITPSGQVLEVAPKNGRDFQLDELNHFVGGHIEIIDLPIDGWIMVLNEEGKLHDLPLNPLATEISGLMPHDYIVGRVLICRKEQVQ